jgi:hypothetical protein
MENIRRCSSFVIFVNVLVKYFSRPTTPGQLFPPRILNVTVGRSVESLEVSAAFEFGLERLPALLLHFFIEEARP